MPAEAGALEPITTQSAPSARTKQRLTPGRSIAAMLGAIITIGLSKVESPGHRRSAMRKGNVQRAILVDFAGTLFLPLDGKQWAIAASDMARVDLTAHESTELAALLDSRFHHVRDPGRDLSLSAYRQSMLPVLESLVTDKALARSLYDLQFKDEFWHLRNGARDLLRGARKRGLRVIIVSNVPWDIRQLFTQAGLRDHVHGFALSFEVGSEKPDKLIFEHAIDLAGCAPSEAVLIGDDPVTDSGALALGIPVILVPPCRDSMDESLPMVTSWLLRTSRMRAGRWPA